MTQTYYIVSMEVMGNISLLFNKLDHLPVDGESRVDL
jgi:hypothetical protein